MPVERTRALSGVELCFLSLSFVFSGCLIDSDRCDAHQVELPGQFAICVCEPGAAPNASGTGCTPCGANEEVLAGLCSCLPGFVKLAGVAGCAQSEIGTACSASEPCPAAFPYCAMNGTTSGYCTRRDCTANADCPESWTCEAADGVRYCRRAPTGLGAPCQSSGDCAAFEASFCEPFQSHTCILQGCATGSVTCPNEWVCCDYSALAGVPLSTCQSAAQLTNGMCQQGGRLVGK